MEKEIDESSLIEGCKAKNRKAQEGLYRLFFGYAMGIALSFSKNKEDAQEIVNDTFIKLFECINTFDEKRSFKAWLRRMVVNKAIDHFRKNVKHRFKDDIDEPGRHIETPEPDVVSKLTATELIGLLQALPEAYRMVFTLYEIEGFSHEEIADTLGIPDGTSRSNLTRAKKKLRELVSQKYGVQYEYRTI